MAIYIQLRKTTEDEPTVEYESDDRGESTAESYGADAPACSSTHDSKREEIAPRRTARQSRAAGDAFCRKHPRATC